jgi:AcrR family transcriptional regulator
MIPGLRERRKQETRQAISGVATQMFLTRGFDAVTISEVAEAAGVAKMTVTNYFPRKEDLVFDRAGAIVRSLADALSGREDAESILAAIRRDYAERAARADVTLGLSSPEFAGMITASPVLAARNREMLEQAERALGDAIAAESGMESGTETGAETSAPDVQQRVVAGLLASVHRTLYAEATRRSLAGESHEDICEVLAAAATRAFDLLEPALGSYGIRAASTLG